MTTATQEVKQSLLELMVNARLSTLLMGIEIMLDCVDLQAFDRHRLDAWNYAVLAGYLYHNQKIPSMFIDVYELEDAWYAGMRRYEEESSENCLLKGGL